MFEIIIIGITLAAVYALVSTGLSLIFGVLRVVNFAHGELFMIGAVTVYLLHQYLPGGYVVAALASIPVMAVVGLLFYAAVIRPIHDKPWQRSLIATLAFSVLTVNSVIVFFGATPRRVATGYEDVQIDLFGVSLSLQRVLIIVVAIVLFTALFGMIQHTKMGTAMRAVSQNPEACVVVGIDVKKVIAFTVILAVTLAGLAGVLVAPILNVWPHMGVQMTFKAFAIVIMGGFGRIHGAIVASVLVGIIESFTAAYVSLALKDSFVFVALILILLIRPAGLFGAKERAA